MGADFVQSQGEGAWEFDGDEKEWETLQGVQKSIKWKKNEGAEWLKDESLDIGCFLHL